MAALLAMSRVRVLAPWLDSSEIVELLMVFQDQDEWRSRANTGSYEHVQYGKGPQQHSATSL